jgi:hypothetical protein
MGKEPEDLVDRLRAASYRMRQVPEPFGPPLYSLEAKEFIPRDAVTLYDLAANEIERLRKENNV